ncbi:MAG: BtpA/SgcQ family protein [Halobacteriota archaeon]
MNRELLGTDKPVIGMVHLPPLPGAPGYDGDRTAIRRRARRDAETLVDGGVDGLIVENFGDVPYYPDEVPPHVVAEMTTVASEVLDHVPCPVGVNVLRNDAEASLAIAAATGAAFVRVNVHTGARVTDQGIVEGWAHETLRLRDRLGAEVRILADVEVKHSTPLGEADVRSETTDVVERGLADGVVVSGRGTGEATDRAQLATVAERAQALGVPVYAGSGVTAQTVADVLSVADGVIVGSALKDGGDPMAPVNLDRVRSFVEAANEATSSGDCGCR